MNLERACSSLVQRGRAEAVAAPSANREQAEEAEKFFSALSAASCSDPDRPCLARVRKCPVRKCPLRRNRLSCAAQLRRENSSGLQSAQVTERSQNEATETAFPDRSGGFSLKSRVRRYETNPPRWSSKRMRTGIDLGRIGCRSEVAVGHSPRAIEMRKTNPTPCIGTAFPDRSGGSSLKSYMRSREANPFCRDGGSRPDDHRGAPGICVVRTFCSIRCRIASVARRS